MFKDDSVFNWKPGRLYIPGNWFTGMTVGTVVTAVGDGWISTHTGNADTREVSTFGIAAPLINAAGDMWQTAYGSSILPNLDISKNIYFRVHWTTASTTSADDMLWKVTYKTLTENQTITAASTPISTVVPSDLATGTAYQWQITDWGWLNGGTLVPEVAALVLNVEADTVDMAVPSTEPSFFLGLEIRYSPKNLQGPGKMRHEAWENQTVWANYQ